MRNDKTRKGVLVAGGVILAGLGWLALRGRAKAEPEPPVYECEICGATFGSQEELEEHYLLYHPDEPPPPPPPPPEKSYLELSLVGCQDECGIGTAKVEVNGDEPFPWSKTGYTNSSGNYRCHVNPGTIQVIISYGGWSTVETIVVGEGETYPLNICYPYW